MTVFSGIYDSTIYRNEEDGYTVFSFVTTELSQYRDAKGNLICCGYIPSYLRGTPLQITGELNKNDKGYNVIVKDIIEFSNTYNITKYYLTSDSFKGIGEKTADKIIKLTGPDIFSFIKKPDACKILSENIKELKGDKAEKFIYNIKNTTCQREIYQYIFKYGANYSQALAMFDIYGINSINELKKDPYLVGFKIGMPFLVCDAIAKDLKFHCFDTRRLTALILKAMQLINNEGSTKTTLDSLHKMVCKISQQSAFEHYIPAEILAVIISNSDLFVIEYSSEYNKNICYIYSKALWTAEKNISKNITRICNSITKLKYSLDIVDSVEKNCNIHYSKLQKQSFNFLSTTGIKILTGGPGTGKTTVINGLIIAYRMLHPDKIITLCAPTGRAAQRMSEATNMPAFTIHKLLDIQPFGDDITCKNSSDPIESDFIIVDEISMADTETFNLLLDAIKSDALVLLCGDCNQLPSVGAGNVLHDLISSEKFPTNALDVVFRQSDTSAIISNANKIRLGDTNLMEANDFKIFKYTNQTLMQKDIVKLYSKLNNQHEDIQILSLTKKQFAGTKLLNVDVQNCCNLQDDVISYGIYQFGIGDKIMMTRNNYEIGYLNGNMGIVKGLSKDGILVEINCNDILIPPKCYPDISLAYSITVHKSQGSEFSSVILAIPNINASILNRNLIYTAITRAKNKVYIFCECNALYNGIQKVNIDHRMTGLVDKIKKI